MIALERLAALDLQLPFDGSNLVVLARLPTATRRLACDPQVNFSWQATVTRKVGWYLTCPRASPLSTTPNALLTPSATA